MKRIAVAVLVVTGAWGRPAAADAWSELSPYSAFPGMIIEGSAVIHPPWGPSIVQVNEGDGGCAYTFEPISGFAFHFDDARFLGLPGARATVAAPDSPGVTDWSLYFHAQCIELMGREIYLEPSQTSVIPSVLSLPSPQTHRCNPLHGSVHLQVEQPASVSLQIPFSHGCGADRVRSDQPLLLTEVRLKVLAGSRGALNSPRIVELDVPPEVCGRRFTGTVRLDVPPVGGAFLFNYGPAPFESFWSGVSEGQTERRVLFDARTLSADEVTTRITPLPRGGETHPEVRRTVRIRPPGDPACFVFRTIPVERYRPRWDGCWNCQLWPTAWREVRVLNLRRMEGGVLRTLNGVVGRNARGDVASVSENANGIPTSFIVGEGTDIVELPGVHLRDLSELGMAVGARIDPQLQLRRAVWFDGARVHDLGTFGGASSEAVALSEAGWAVGWAEDQEGARRAFLARDGKLEALPLPAHLESEASSVGGNRWIVGSLLTKEGRRGFLLDVETGTAHLTDPPEADAGYHFVQVNERGRALGTMTRGNQEVVPVVFSADQGLMHFDQLADLPQGFVAEEAVGIADDGSVLLAGRLDGERAYFRFSH